MVLLRAFIGLLSITSIVQANPTRTLQAPGPSETDPSPDDNTCSDYKTCSSKGHAYWEQLQAKLSEARPVDRNDAETFNKDYKCEYISLDFDTPSLVRIRPDLADHGVDWQWVEPQAVFSINPVTGKDTEVTAYTNLFTTSKGIIVAFENYRDEDEQKTLPWSELMYQAWSYAREWDDFRKEQGIIKGHPGGGPISRLSTVIQLDVQNQETVKVLQTIWTNQKLEWNILDKTWYKVTEADPATRNWFYALLGTANVKGTAFLLKDHAAEIEKKTITEIWVRWPYVYPDIWINVGPSTQATSGSISVE
ncbi:MAG: hypothetical protein L6R39_003439 [Caloplaca ligustica]|nr:MAG: hypothetical protein L6R39_003439 [Caloplaca ligustica]